MSADSFVLGVLGDFGGQPRELDARRFLGIDRDNFDEVMGRLGVSFAAAVPNRLEAGELAVAIRFASPDDFHPDRVVARVPALAALVKARAGVPSAEELERLRVQRAPRPEPAATAAPAGLLDAIIGQGSARGETRWASADPAFERFVREVAEPALERTDLDLLARWQQAVDEVVGHQLREILYHPRFQALEATWRGLHELVANTETGPGLVIRVLDLPKAELARDLARLSAGDECALTRLVCGEAETFGGTPYAAVIADYAFGPSEIDVTLLEVMAQVAARTGAPFIAAARPTLLGLEDFRELGDSDVRARIGQGRELAAWRELKASEAARHLVLCVPRVLLRLPYGAEGEPVTSFGFEEGLTGTDHARYLWGSPALAVGRVLTRAFARDGWAMDATEDTRLNGLPLHVYRDQGEARALPCAEVVMTESTLRRVAEEGFVAVASFKDADEAVVYGMRTVSGGRLAVRRP